ncbi:kelch repeat-containing protein [Luteolibacter marinus]|uniref:kelch repeat-containing protein n=1 Tax=Luteolibacter marinus TaxID=2776705 RepID=UPI00186812E9|nr:kelch repeat-containing protein [Luteolibacter marinus]
MPPVSRSITRPLLAATLVAAAPASAQPVRVSSLPDVPDAHGFAGAFCGIHRGHLIAAGGANFPDGVMPWDGGKKVWHDQILALDLIASGATWKRIGKLPEPSGYGVSLTTPDGILLIGGGNASTHSRKVSRLRLDDSGKPVLVAMPELPRPLAQMAGALVGQQVHLCGGIESPDATRATPGHWMLDLEDRERGWQVLPTIPGDGRILATAAAVNGAFFVIGGCSLSPNEEGEPQRRYLKDAWKFADGSWTRLADPPRAATAAASPAPVAGNAIFLVSGDDGSQTGLASPADHPGFPRDILRYDVAHNSWSEAGRLDFPAPVTLPTAPWDGGFIFFNGEVKPGVRTPRVFLLQPAP